MTEELEVIKWACEHGYAEGFGPVELFHQTHGGKNRICCGVYPNHGISKSIYIDTGIWENVYWPLFLQRTIEGINRIDRKYRVEQMYNSIDILDSEEYACQTTIDFMDYPDNDQAKFAAIKYVKEHME